MSENEKATNPTDDSAFKKKRTLLTIAFILTTFVPLFGTGVRSIILTTALTQYNAMEVYAVLLISGAIGQTSMTPISGKLGDLFGRKKMIIVGQILYLIGLVLVWIAPSVWSFASGVLIMGVGAGCISAVVKTSIGELYPDKAERDKALGFNDTFSKAANLLAPIIGGWFADNVGWKYSYVILIPLMVAGFIIVMTQMPESSKKDTKPVIDVKGIIMYLVFVVSMLLLLSGTGSIIKRGSTVYWIMMAASVIGFILLLIVEKGNDNAIIPLKMFANKEFAILWCVSMLANICYMSSSYWARLLQQIYGVSATLSGTLQTPRGVASMLAGAIIGMVSSRIPSKKKVIIGEVAILLVSLVIMYFFPNTLNAPLFIIATCLYMFAITAVLLTAISYTMQIVERKHIGIAVSLIVLTASLGGTVGSAFGGMLMTRKWETASSLVPAAMSDALGEAGVKTLCTQTTLSNASRLAELEAMLPADLKAQLPQVVANLKGLLMSGFKSIQLICIVFAAVALVLALAMKEKEQG